ncbi:MAG: c-type cytochrome [Burkholderiales bacterium]
MKNLLLVLCAAFMLAGCERAMQNMYDQPRYKPLRAAPDLPGGSSSRPLPADSVIHSRGNLAATSSGAVGEGDAQQDERAMTAQTMPFPVTSYIIHRGRDRYTIYCAPCHSPVGDGDGLVARRGFPHPPSYHIDRLRQAPDRHFFDVMTDGYGIMYSYADRVSPQDRWAIVAYIRALQLSQHAELAQLPPDVRSQLPAQGSAR